MSARRLLTILMFLILPAGCRQEGVGTSSGEAPVVRVRLLAAQDRVTVAATQPPTVQVANASPRTVDLRGNTISLALSPSGWQLGNLNIGQGELTFRPSSGGTLSVNGQAYRGFYKFVPIGGGKFDVVNHVDIDGYLKGVIAEELYKTWHIEAYRAQAIVARTYALYESRTSPANRHWDLYSDVRSQVYNGIGAETAKSRDAVDATSGIVVTYQGKIFKAYFSSCCGGISQTATEAFGDAYIPPLSDQNNHNLCNASPKFNWGPIAVDKSVLTERFRKWGANRDRPEKNMSLVTRIDIQQANRWGRPVRFLITDASNRRYSWTGEEIRWAVNTNAPPGETLSSSYFKLIIAPDKIHFVDGHGFGHGVGLCQWCAQRRAEGGMRHEDIVLAAYQKAKLVRGY